MSYCRNCGNQLAETVKFCNKCGSKTDMYGSTNTIIQNSTTDKGTKHKGGVISFVILIVIFISSNILFFDYLSANWMMKISYSLYILIPERILGIVLLIAGTIYSAKRYKKFQLLKLVLIFNVLMVIMVHFITIILVPFSPDGDIEKIAHLNIILNIIIGAVILINVYVIIKYSVQTYKNGFKIWFGR